MTGLEEIQRARAAGFSDAEIEEGIAEEKRKAVSAGFSPDEVDAYYGRPPFDPEPVKKFVQSNLTKPAGSFLEALDAGFQTSVSGLAVRGKNPELVLPEDAPRLHKIASFTSSAFFDLPGIIGGAALGLGGGPVAMTAGAFALPAGLRRIMMDKYEKGEVTGFSDFWDRLSGAVLDTTKGWVTGAVTGGVGKAIQAAPIASPALKTAAQFTGEVATMTTIGAALEGHVPDADEFVNTAIALGFVKGGVAATQRAAGKMREIYARTGVRPQDVAQDAQANPSILHELSSESRAIPKVYQDAEADMIAKLRREKSPMKVERRETGAYVDVIPVKPITQLAGEAITPSVEKTSEAGAFRAEPYGNEALHQEGTILARPMTEDEQMQQYAAVALNELFPVPRPKHAVTDPYDAPSWYRKMLEVTTAAPWEIDRSLERLRETGQPTNSLDKQVLDQLINDQSLIRTVEKLTKEVPDTQLRRARYDKDRAFRTAEEILQERNVLKSAEDMISHEPKPKLRNQMYILPKGRGPVLDPADMAEITNELHAKGIVFGEAGKAKWEENIPLEEAQEKILKQIVQHEPGSERLTLSALYTSIFDNLHPIKEAVGNLGKELPPGQDPYTLMRLTRGLMGKAQQFLDFGAIDFNTYAKKTRGYTQILESVKKDLDGFRAYMASKRAIERAERGIETSFDMEAAKPVVRAGKGKYDKAFQERLGFIRARLEYLRDSGILNQRKFDALEEASKDYVAFHPVFEEEVPPTVRSESGAVRDPVKKMKGGNYKIVDPIVSDIKDTFLFLGLAEKNAARRAFVSIAGDAATLVRRASEPITKKEIQEIVKEHGVGEAAAEAIAALRPSSFRAGKGELVVFEDGVRNIYKVDPKLAEAFEDLDRVSASMLAKVFLHAPAGWLRAGVTLTPEFMARNVLRDAIASFIYAGSNPLKTIKGGVSLLKQDTAYQKWLAGGGANATMVAIDRDYIQSHIFKLNAETGIAERALNVMKTPLDLLRVMSEFVENSTRLGAVRDSLNKTETKATIQALAMLSREATVDFGRHGRDLQNVSKSISFFNPHIQGIDRFARALKTDFGWTMAKAFGAVTLPSLMLWYANRNDEEIKDLEAGWERIFMHARIPLPNGDSFILRIPYSHEIGIMFGRLPVMLVDKFIGENPDAMKHVDEMMINMLTPGMVPQVAVPVVEQFANRSMFTHSPLVPASLEGLNPEYQYTEYTSEAAKALGRMFGAFPGMTKRAITDENFIGGVARALTTPAHIDNYVRQWTGGMGVYALSLVDQELQRRGIAPTPVRPAATLADIPVIKAFVSRYPSANVQTIQDFYTNYYHAKRYYDTIGHLSEQGDPRAADLMAQHSEKMVQLDGMRETLTGLSKLIHDVNVNPEMTPSDKRQLIDTQYYAMIQLARAGNKMYRDLGVDQ